MYFLILSPACIDSTYHHKHITRIYRTASFLPKSSCLLCIQLVPDPQPYETYNGIYIPQV